MTITMTSKNQITIPKKIVNFLQLNKGSMFNVQIIGNKIQLIPVELVEKIFTEEEYTKINKVFKDEKNKAKRVTSSYISNLKKSK